jgi:hypothetical protein
VVEEHESHGSLRNRSPGTFYPIISLSYIVNPILPSYYFGSLLLGSVV